MRRGVELPASIAAGAQAPGLLPNAAQRVCPILIARPGRLNLRCAIANLPNPSATSPLSPAQQLQVLNALLALAPRTAAAPA